MSFFEELKRRSVVRVGIAYAVAAWVLLQMFDIIGEILELPAWGGKMILAALVIGFFLALILAWVFQLTPEGLKKETEIDRSQPVTRSTGRKLNSVTMVLMAVALAWFAWDKFGPGPDTAVTAAVEPAASTTAAVAAHSIAVLPFIDMSPEKDQEYLSDGIAEELLNLLVKIPDLQVAARTSSFSFKGKEFTIADVARELHVANVLEGSVRKSGNRVRITAQLIQTGSGFHLYSETFDRALDDVFGIQDEISAAVVEALKIKLLGARPKSVEYDPEAYALYLQGRYFFARRTRADWENAARAYQEALQIDPDYTAAWAGLSLVYANQAGAAYIDLHTGYVLARQAAQKALALACVGHHAEHGRCRDRDGIAATLPGRSRPGHRPGKARGGAGSAEPAGSSRAGHGADLCRSAGRGGASLPAPAEAELGDAHRQPGPCARAAVTGPAAGGAGHCRAGS